MALRRLYETTVIVNAALEDSDIDSVISRIAGYIENNGGQLVEVNKWGRRRLAYPINKKFNGFYVHLVFETLPNSVPILERFLVLEDTVLRHLTLILTKKLDEFRRRRLLEEGKNYAPMGELRQDEQKATVQPELILKTVVEEVEEDIEI
ncbi:MAG: ribosomal protein [Ignavibacteria bacterium]|nr:ribosomal protein [Ignavibacteria bacterium]